MTPPPDDFAPLLEARDLSSVRGGRRLFERLSFALNGGEWVEISGANGAGKTTLLRILSGLRDPDGGETLWRGVPVRRAAEDYFADLAFVGHRDGVKLKLTPPENLRAWLNARDDPDESDAATTRISAALELVGMSPASRMLCAGLSAGQRRRVALARLSLTSARVWILDEPLSSLDEAARETMSRLLAKHLRNGGVAAIATHHPFPLPLPRPRKLVLGP